MFDRLDTIHRKVMLYLNATYNLPNKLYTSNNIMIFGNPSKYFNYVFTTNIHYLNYLLSFRKEFDVHFIDMIPLYEEYETIDKKIIIQKNSTELKTNQEKYKKEKFVAQYLFVLIMQKLDPIRESSGIYKELNKYVIVPFDNFKVLLDNKNKFVSSRDLIKNIIDVHKESINKHKVILKSLIAIKDNFPKDAILQLDKIKNWKINLKNGNIINIDPIVYNKKYTILHNDIKKDKLLMSIYKMDKEKYKNVYQKIIK